MPPKLNKPVGKAKEIAKAAGGGGVKKKVTAKGYKKPVPIPNGEILTDVSRQQWKIGPSIGSGGFGEIYSACKLGESSKDYNYVVKIEPHENGPLFVEMHFYSKNAKLPDIEQFRKDRKLKSLGMPHYIGHGSHELNSIKHRFVVMPRYGRDVWSFFLENGKILPQPTVYRIAIQMLDVLEYIHHCTYVHADLKGANILLGHGKSGTNQAYLVDFGLVSHYTNKDFKPDPKKMHNGTIEYTSRDAHNGVPTMRSDMEILAYNIVHWSGMTLPWESEGLLTVPKKVQESKEKFMSDVVASLKKYFPACPETIVNYFKYVTTLKYNDTPDYEKCRQMFETALKKLGETNSGELKFKSSPTAGPSKKVTVAQSKAAVPSESPRKRAKKVQPLIVDTDSDSTSEVENISPIKKTKKRVIAQENATSKEKRIRITPSIDKVNSTAASSVVVNNKIPVKEKSSKTYNINLELDLSIDANVVINVKRKPKKGKSVKGSEPNSVLDAASDDDEDVIPNSNDNTPVAKVRVFKNKIGTPKKTPRKSPRSAL